tara:strand:+ start:1248 stop:2528 length:1281 start_codon:yes stop_codon:yes gene_type:complete
MASALGSAKYTKIDIQKKKSKKYGRGSRKIVKTRVDLKGKVTNFSYYESLYSPIVTASLIYEEAGDSTKSSLPISGNEDLFFIIESKYGKLNFSKDDTALKVNVVPEAGKQSNREAVYLGLISQYEVKDKKRQVSKKYYNTPISSSVEKILKEYFQVPKSRMHIEETKNMYDFIGKGKNPIEIITKLARKSVPVKGDPGYFFFETQEGFNFKSINYLVAQRPKATYSYSGGFQANSDNDRNDYKIMIEPKFIKDQDVMNAVTSGTYVSRNIFFNPQNAKYIEKIYKINEEGNVEKTLGTDLEVDDELDGYVRTNMHVLDVGSLKTGVSDAVNNSPLEWQAKSTMRYNILHTQMLDIQVPCNLNLMAGDVVKVEIENLQTEKCNEPVNKHQSGKYLILHLCHSFKANESVTSMTLVRDTYGLHTGKK